VGEVAGNKILNIMLFSYICIRAYQCLTRFLLSGVLGCSFGLDHFHVHVLAYICFHHVRTLHGGV
jgi:hypothetical protein